MTDQPKLNVMTTFTAAELLATSRKIHETARAKGWWIINEAGFSVISEDDTDEKLFLVVSELAEAFEVFRASKGDAELKNIYFEVPSIMTDHGQSMVEKIVVSDDELLSHYAGKHKPEGFPVEVGDAYIRILDLIGALAPELDLSAVIFYMTAADHYIATEMEPTANMGRIMCEITRAVTVIGEGDVPSVLKAVFLGLGLIESACKDIEVPLRKAIELKMTYNDTRPIRHGGKRA